MQKYNLFPLTRNDQLEKNLKYIVYEKHFVNFINLI